MLWVMSHPASAAALVLWIIGILLLMPGRRASSVRTPRLGLAIAGLGVAAFCYTSGKPHADLANEVMFWLFSVSALLCGVLMITARNPVYAALWFALATLSTCGLFLLQSAPFLAAATVIVYAGAVIVTFLFVIMLAQQSGAAGYDRRSQQSVPATLGAFLLLGLIMMTLQTEKLTFPRTESADASAATTVVANSLSRADGDRPTGSMKGLGRSLFGDYLFAVELAGTLLLVASIGAIAIAPRREQGAL